MKLCAVVVVVVVQEVDTTVFFSWASTSIRVLCVLCGSESRPCVVPVVVQLPRRTELWRKQLRVTDVSGITVLMLAARGGAVGILEEVVQRVRAAQVQAGTDDLAV